MSSVTTIPLCPYEWQEIDGDNLTILAWCHDRDSNTHLVRIEDFTPFIYCELPEYVGGRLFKWDPVSASYFFKYLVGALKDDAPIKYVWKPSADLYYYQGNAKKPYIMLIFKNLKSQKHAVALLNRELDFKLRLRSGWCNFGYMKVTPAEYDIPVIRKMLTARDSCFSGWINFGGKNPLPRNHCDLYDEEDDGAITKDALGNKVIKSASTTYESISTLPITNEWVTSWNNISMVPEEEVSGWTTRPKVLAFDLEAYSDNHRIFPDMWNEIHCTFMNSCVYQIAGKPETRVSYGIVMGDVNSIPDEVMKGINIIRVQNQLELIRAMFELIVKHDVDVITGYNIMDFDLPFLNAKLELELEAWPSASRLVNDITELKSWDWESGGYGFNSINILKCSGRICIDMYPVVRRDNKLLKYNLDTVAAKFLGRKKHDVSPAEMFTTYERSTSATSEFYRNLGIALPGCRLPADNEWVFANQALKDGEDEYKEAVTECIFNEESFMTFGKHVGEILRDANSALCDYMSTLDTPEGYQLWKDKNANTDHSTRDNVNDQRKGGAYNRHGKLNWCSEELYTYMTDIARQYIEENYKLLDEYPSLTPDVLACYIVGNFLMTRVLIYCMIDSDITIDLFDKLNTWIGLIQMSKVVGVSVTDIFTRGQQIRCLSQLYDVAAKEGIILSKRASPDIFFNGGFVFHPQPGLYDAIVVVDFNSLYPSIMMANNICHTTLLAPEDFNLFPKEQVYTIEVPRPDHKAKDGADYDVEQPDHDPENDNEEDTPNILGSLVKSLSSAVTYGGNYYFRYVKPEVRKGLIPSIVRNLVEERKRVRKVEQVKYEKNSIGWLIAEKTQLALKVSANSMFGFLGAGKMGKRSLIEGAMSITARGRQLIQYVNKYCEEKYGANIVYGDSVTGDTPVLVRQESDMIYKEIQDLADKSWIKAGDKELSIVDNLEVWTDEGFTRVKHIIRHKTSKKLYRITTRTGSVKVTQDHSLISKSGKLIKPGEVKIGDELLSQDIPKIKDPYRWVIVAESELEAARKWMELESPSELVRVDGKYAFIPSDNIESPDEIVSIEEIGITGEYVYDLETYNHRFAAGVGRIVVHNTDSSMIDLHLKDPKSFNKAGHAIAKELSDLFPEDLNLECEKVIKAIFIKPKFYIAYVYDDDGNLILIDIDDPDSIPFLYVKGVILARRDYPPFAHKIYERTARNLLDEKPLYVIVSDIIEHVKSLLRGEVDYNDLVMVKGISAHYKNDKFYMKMFSDRLSRMGRPAKPGERLGYIIHKARNEDEEKYLGNRMITPELYEESKFNGDSMEVDYMYYLEKQMTTNMDALFYAGINRRFAPYASIKVRRSRRCKYVSLMHPMKFIGSMLRSGYYIDDLDLILADIKAIDDGRPQDVLLKEGYDRHVEVSKSTRVSEPETKRVDVDWDALFRTASEMKARNMSPVGVNNPTGLRFG